MTAMTDDFDPNILYCVPCQAGDVLCERHHSSAVDTAIEAALTAFTGQGRRLQARHAHSWGVWERAISLSGGSGQFNLPLMHFRESLALLHDIGYAFPDSGMHALDGARHLRDEHPDLAHLAPYVAWHSTAAYEYRARGFDEAAVAQEFPLPSRSRDEVERALLWIADFTTSPTGQEVTLVERLADIRERYEVDSPVTRALEESLPDLARAEKVVRETFGVERVL